MFSSFIKKIFHPIKESCPSAVIFALGCFFYFGLSPFGHDFNYFLNIVFYSCTVLTLVILAYFNRTKSFFETIILVVGYLVLSNIKRESGITYWSSAEYCYLSVLLPLNLGYFFFYKNEEKIFSRKTIYILLTLLIEYSVFENLCLSNINFLSFPVFFGLNNLSFAVFTFVILACFIKANRFGGISYRADFFRNLSIFLAFLLSVQISAIYLFFAVASVITLIETISCIFNESFYDSQTGVFNQNTYMKQIAKDIFPLKYCISVTRIDNCESLSKEYGYKSFTKLLKMVVGQLGNTKEISGIYRFSEDIFLLIFFDKNREEGFELVENIRREIATAEFMLNRPKKSIKLTITSAVTERKRSDFEPVSIISRAYIKMKSSLSQNVTLKA